MDENKTNAVETVEQEEVKATVNTDVKANDEPKPRTYTDEEVDNIISKRRSRWAKEQDKKIKEQTELLLNQVDDLTKKLADMEKNNEDLKVQSIKKDKLSEVRKQLRSENVINVDLMIPHINLDNVEVDENGGINLGNTIEILKEQFPNAFGTVTPSNNAVPTKGTKIEPLNDIQRANQAIKNKSNKNAIDYLLKAGKI